MEHVKSLIEGEFPSFRVDSIEKLGEGWRNEAYLVNEKFVFRFAKSEAASKELEKEAALLPLLQTYVSVTIPDFRYVSINGSGLSFAGYELLKGVLLDEDGVRKLDQSIRKTLADDLARFITELRSFPAQRAVKLGAPAVDPGVLFEQMYRDAKLHIFPLMSRQLQNYVASRFDAYLNTADYFSYTPCLVHGDLSPDHFVFDSSVSRLTGIIDFGDLCVTDPDYEFVYILEDGGKEFARDVLRGCGETDVDRCLEKLSLFVTFDHVRFVLEGVRKGEEAWILEGLSALEEEMVI